MTNSEGIEAVQAVMTMRCWAGFSGKGRIMRAGNVATAALGLVLAGLTWVALPVQAQTGPLANTSVANARVIVPDGSSLLQAQTPGETRWFVFGAEPGKTYVVEAVDPSDLVGTDRGVFAYGASGVAAPPEASVDCTANLRAPALEVASDGKRCIVRTFPPSPGNTQNKRGSMCRSGR